MARNRMITPEFWLDEDLAKLTPHARLLYIGLWAICDDNYATLPNRPEWIKAQIFPYEEININKTLDELSRGGKIIPFKAEDNKEFWWIKNFFKYQTIDRPSKPKYPEYKPNTNTLDEYSTNTRPKDKLSKDKLNINGGVFFSKTGKEIHLETGETYKPDYNNPLDVKNNKKKLERALGLARTNKWASLIFGIGWDFLKAYEATYKTKYFGNVVLDGVAKNLSKWYEAGETRESLREMIMGFLESEKRERVGMSPTTVFSVDTYNKWKAGELKPKKKPKQFL